MGSPPYSRARFMHTDFVKQCPCTQQGTSTARCRRISTWQRSSNSSVLNLRGETSRLECNRLVNELSFEYRDLSAEEQEDKAIRLAQLVCCVTCNQQNQHLDIVRDTMAILTAMMSSPRTAGNIFCSLQASGAAVDGSPIPAPSALSRTCQTRSPSTSPSVFVTSRSAVHDTPTPAPRPRVRRPTRSPTPSPSVFDIDQIAQHNHARPWTMSAASEFKIATLPPLPAKPRGSRPDTASPPSPSFDEVLTPTSSSATPGLSQHTRAPAPAPVPDRSKISPSSQASSVTFGRPQTPSLVDEVSNFSNLNYFQSSSRRKRAPTLPPGRPCKSAGEDAVLVADLRAQLTAAQSEVKELRKVQRRHGMLRELVRRCVGILQDFLTDAEE